MRDGRLHDTLVRLDATQVTRDSPLSPDGVRHVTTSRRWRIVPDLY
ncbi:hypothetical protein [Burkholderia cepacia]